MHQPTMSDHVVPAEPKDAAKRILLLDHDDHRRGMRVRALVERGALVDGASETQVARALWKEAAYDLVLVDLRGADAECEAFLVSLRVDRAHQKFGFYISHPPYITSSAADCRRAIPQELPSAVNGVKFSTEQARLRPATGLAVATQKIRAARHFARLAADGRRLADEADERRARVERESEAMQLAKRTLGGS